MFEEFIEIAKLSEARDLVRARESKDDLDRPPIHYLSAGESRKFIADKSWRDLDSSLQRTVAELPSSEFDRLIGLALFGRDYIPSDGPMLSILRQEIVRAHALDQLSRAAYITEKPLHRYLKAAEQKFAGTFEYREEIEDDLAVDDY
jgi:hypothetical protein